MTAWPAPWPIDGLIQALQSGDNLERLVTRGKGDKSRDVREDQLEQLLKGVSEVRFGPDCVSVRRQARTTLGLKTAPFPGATQPDLGLRVYGRIHFCEAKSNRVDYPRFDNVFGSPPFKAFLAERGHKGAAPWEVEQDLIKLHLYPTLSPNVGGCLFVMVDGYVGTGLSWSRVFGSPQLFAKTMRTNLVRGLAEELTAATRIMPLLVGGTRANLIICDVRPERGGTVLDPPGDP